MIKLEAGNYVVQLPEHFLYQDINPENGQPFVSEAAAQAWEDAYLITAALAQAEKDAAFEAAAPIRLDEHKARKVAEIRAHFAGFVDSLKADAAPYEVETWPVQTAEYSAWMAKSTTPTPYVSALAAARGMPLADLMAKIGAKVAGLAQVQGAQQALEAAVKAATTEAEVDAVAW